MRWNEWRPSYIPALLSTTSRTNGERFQSSLIYLCSFYLPGKLNANILPIVSGTSLVASRKKDGGIRPNEVSKFFKHLIAKLSCTKIRESWETCLVQYNLVLEHLAKAQLPPINAENGQYNNQQHTWNHEQNQRTILLESSETNNENGEIQFEKLEILLNKCPDESKMPTNWNSAIIPLLHKKKT